MACIARRTSRLPLLALSSLTLLGMPGSAFAADAHIDLTGHWAGYTAVTLFVLAYLMVIMEEFTQLRKSQPVMLAAGVIWALLAAVTATEGNSGAAHVAVGNYLLEYAQLLLFLLAAMTYVNALSERNVFDALRSWLVRRGLGYRALFWMTGALSFALSPLPLSFTV